MKKTEGMTSSSESWQDKYDDLTPEQKEVYEQFMSFYEKGIELIVNSIVAMVNCVAKLIKEAEESGDPEEGSEDDEA